MSRSTSASGRMSRSLSWRHDGRRLIMPVNVYPGRPATLDGVEARALIDTGSTTTGVTTALAEQLGLTGRGKKPMGGIGGDMQIERYLFRIGLTADAEHGAPPSFPFVFEDLEGFALRSGFQFEVLLGMDILGQCDLKVGRDRRCSLTFG